MALHQEVTQPSTTTEVSTTKSSRHTRRWWLVLLATLIVISVRGWTLQKIVRANIGAVASANPATTQTAQTTLQTNALTVDTTAANAASTAPARIVTTEQTTDLATVTDVAQLSPTNQGVATLIVLIGAEGATLRSAPADPSGQALAAGVVLTAVGRTEDSNWLAVQAVDGTSGWIATTELVVFGVTRLPVLDPAAFTVNLPTGETTPVTTVALSPTVTTTTAVLSETITTTTTAAISTVTTTDSAAAVTASAIVTLSSGRLNVRSGPGTGYAIVAKANAGDEVSVLARNDAADWLQIQLPNSTDGVGWVAARYLDLAGDLTELPVSTIESSAPALVSTAAVATTMTAAASDAATAVTAATSSGTVQTVATTGVASIANSSNADTVTGLSGTLVFQSSPGGMIYAYDLDNGRLWQLSNGFDPAISPNGNQVAFVREGGENGLYLINIDGSNERLIFSGRAALSSPKWSPDGQWLLFTRGDEYSECVDLGRGGCVSPGSLPPNMPTDGLTLSKKYEHNLARVDTNGDNYRDLATLESARAADWNEAGIVYQSSAGLQITADSADATNRLLYFQALQPPVEDPDWQPNGGQVLFVQHHGSHYEIFTMNADGSGVTALTRPVTTLVDQMPNNLAPAWNPDGQHIVFLSNRAANNEAGAWRLWVMNADGRNQQPLPIDITINYTYGNEQAVSWGI